ncbi:MAG: DJ-1 family protein [Verrucomicrobia bacterium]|nr:DJ-1 family protein [Verrucomicrobiota bacterium]
MTEAPLSALVLLFEGFEEVEALTPVDLLTRANVAVTLAGIDTPETVTGRSGISVQLACELKDLPIQDFDCLILPGGPGIAKLRRHPLLCKTLRKQYQSGRTLACICAAPLLMLDAGILPGPAYTCHPSAENELPDAQNKALVRDHDCITARGAGNALPFSLALIQHLIDNETAHSIARAICSPENPNL